jgi:hypothetical protein
MSRIVVIGNSASGKSTLARHLADRRALPLFDLDFLLWEPARPTPLADYARQHAEVIAGERWVIDGLGHQSSIGERLVRCTEIILIDLPLWVHFWLAAERHDAWVRGLSNAPPIGPGRIPLIKQLFETMWEVDQTWLPHIRRMCAEAELQGKAVTRLGSVDEIDTFARSL